MSLIQERIIEERVVPVLRSKTIEDARLIIDRLTTIRQVLEITLTTPGSCEGDLQNLANRGQAVDYKARVLDCFGPKHRHDSLLDNALLYEAHWVSRSENASCAFDVSAFRATSPKPTASSLGTNR